MEGAEIHTQTTRVVVDHGGIPDVFTESKMRLEQRFAQSGEHARLALPDMSMVTVPKPLLPLSQFAT